MIFLYQVEFEGKFDFCVSGAVAQIDIQQVADFLEAVFYGVVVKIQLVGSKF